MAQTDELHQSSSFVAFVLLSLVQKMSESIHKSYSFLCSILISRTFVFQTFVFFVCFLSQVQSLYFEYTPSDTNFFFCNDSSPVYRPYGAFQLTTNSRDRSSQNSIGRVSYSQPVQLWDKSTNTTTNFTTHFSLKITQIGEDPGYYPHGDGITFFLTPFNDSTACAPSSSGGGNLGLVSAKGQTFSVKDPFVAVEFDTFNNKRWDPMDTDGKYDHVGIDVNSINSSVSAPWSVENGTMANVWITYDSSTKNLSVYVTYDADPVFNGQSNLSYVVDLSSILPEKVRVGFSSSTGIYLELHYILSWEFNSTLSVNTDVTVPPTSKSHPTAGKTQSNSHSSLVVGLVAGASILTIGSALVVFMWRRRRSGASSNDLHLVDDEFDQDTWPKRFAYRELSRATNYFSEEGKLGQGGFGEVYKGFLTGLNREIAVKKITRGSEQGIKEYMSEVKAIRCLRHKNLVQLLGWCHERGDLILVYEYLPNGSLDTHLYAGKRVNVLPWAVRYRIAQDLASVLLYLHHEWEQCVLHRDIKSSNVMLDSDFNAKLGDFGLARLVDHNLGSQTTALAGSLGYVAPECFTAGKASKETDVYSFGVVALEIACGRRSVELKEEPSKVNLIEWVWSLYGEGHLLEAVDKRLEGEFNMQEVECLLVVGLWCCHPDPTSRPSIRQAISVLNLESPIPSLPMKLPVPYYHPPPVYMSTCDTTPSSGSSKTTGSSGITSFSSHSAASEIAS